MRINAVLPRRLGKKIQKRRRELGMTQEQLAEKAHISRAYMGYIEQARNTPTLETLEKIAKGIKTSISELLK